MEIYRNGSQKINECNKGNINYKKYYGLARLTLMVVLIAILIVSSWQSTFVEASGTIHDRLIRVGLLFDEGAHTNAVPYVTLSAPSGLDITISGTNINIPLRNSFPHEEVIFHVDQYYLVVEETYDLQRANSIVAHLKNSNYSPFIVNENLLVDTRYQVVVGYFNNASQAQTIAAKIKNETTYSPILQGSFRVQAGAFIDMNKATALIEKFRKNGFVAYLAVSNQEQNVIYKVFVGNDISETNRNQTKENLSIAFPDEQFINPTDPNYILVKSVHANGKMVDSIAFHTNQKLLVKASMGSGVPIVKVNERFNRSYRGTIELSSHNNKLAVVNELPMDEYLYGVVPREMASGWPMEALKAQAVIARTFALGRNRWKIAQVVDDVKDQAYWGYSIEAQDTSRAVDETRGQLLRTSNGGLAETFYSSNSGGMTAEGTEVWGTSISYLKPVLSPYDAVVLERHSKWYRVMLSNGSTGYIHSNFVIPSGHYNGAGFEKGKIQGSNVNVRSNADVFHTSLDKVNTGDSVIIIDEAHENNAYKWSKGPYTAIELRNIINANQRSINPVILDPVLSLEVSKVGESGRVMEVKANGNVVPVSSPDAHRTLFREGGVSLRSGKFKIDAKGEYTILGANGNQASYPQSDSAAKLYAVGSSSISSNSHQTFEVNGSSKEFVVLNKNGEARVATKRQEYVFNGYGFGHGFGLSQWGAYGMAIHKDEFGNTVYDYKDILHHYYSNDVYLTAIE